MKLINTSKYSSPFLRALIRWICKQYDLDPAKIREAKFTHTKTGFRGCAFEHSHRFLVRANPEAKGFPCDHSYPGLKTAPRYQLLDHIEALVNVTAHEVCHIDQFVAKVKRISEVQTEHWTKKITELFRSQREALLSLWPAPLAAIPPEGASTPRLIDLRAEKALSDLARWQGKLKLARTKVAKYKRKVYYYARQQAKPILPKKPRKSRARLIPPDGAFWLPACLEPYRHLIESIETKRDSGCSNWIHLIPQHWVPGEEVHSIICETWREAIDALKTVEKCTCCLSEEEEKALTADPVTPSEICS